ncbi:MAG TPA: hypothetical protein VHQ64_02885 [Pyrinomonadaceae bacterium]|jgi:hypothetical protein|nr:hypothetical protein [Pyrinomonadaceae bacterium]
MFSKSGSTQKLLLGAFRYLGLVNHKDFPTDELKALIGAEGTDRRSIWRRIVVKAYPAFFNSKFLETATFDEVAEIFSKEVSSKNTIRKCVTFLCYAAKDAGFKVSPNVKPYAGMRSSTAQISHARDGKPRRSSAKGRVDSKSEHTSSSFKLLLDKFPSFDPTWPPEVINNWLSGVEGAAIIAGDGKAPARLSGLENSQGEDGEDERQLSLWPAT